MRKIISLILVLTIILCVSGCTKAAPENDEKGGISSSENNSDSSEDNKTSKDGALGNGLPNENSNGGDLDNDSVSTVTKEDVKINSLDKLNFYAVKKAIAEGEVAELSGTERSNSQITNLSGSGNGGLLNLANSTATTINANSTFTITMYSYFTVTLSDVKGFLAQKLGGTGSVEVVITKNNFNNMITFKKGERYYSCFEVSSNENAISFSSHKYVNGFKLVENYDQENYEFTVYFDGDRVIGINSGRYYSDKSSYKYSPDNISLKDKFSFVVFKKQSFTAEQLEKLFSNNNSFVDDGVVLADGTILFGESSVTNTPVYFKTGQNATVLTNADIKKISAIHSTKYGICLRLDLKDSSKISGKVNLNFYLDKTRVMKLTLEKDGGTVYILGFDSKSKMSDIFYKLTAADSQNKIGRIITPEEFEREISKKVNLNNYSLEINDYSDYYNDGYDAKHIYTLKEDKNLNYTPENYEITIDGITFSLPIKVSDFIDLGFEITEKQFSSGILMGGISFKTPKGKTFDTFAMNFYGNSTNFYNCYITQIDVMFYEHKLVYEEGIRYTAPEIDVLHGINKNSTLDDIISRLGAPNKMYVQFSENKDIGYRNCQIQLHFNFATPSIPNGYFVCNIYPVKNKAVPSDFLYTFGIVLQ